MRSKWQVVVVGIALLILSGCGKPEIGKTDVSYLTEAIVRKDGKFHGLTKVGSEQSNYTQIAFNKDGSLIVYCHGPIKDSKTYKHLGDFYLYMVGKWSKDGSLIKSKFSFEGEIVRYKIDGTGKKVKHPTYRYDTTNNPKQVNQYHLGKNQKLIKSDVNIQSVKQKPDKYVNILPQKSGLQNGKSSFKAKVKQLHATKE